MAYNVLKGAVDGSVDQHGDQEINGVKVFKNTVSASVFWDTDAQSPCATMKDVAIKKVTGGSTGGVLTYTAAGEATSNFNLTFDGTTLTTKNLSAACIEGDASDIRNVPPDRFNGTIPAHAIKMGNGLTNVRGNLQIQTHEGMVVDQNGLSISLANNGGMTLTGNKLTIDASKTTNVTESGQNLSDQDLLMVSDISRGNIVHTTLNNFYEGYIKNKVQHAAGKINEIQVKGGQGFTSSPNFSYDISTNTLKVDGTTRTQNLKVTGDITCEGAVFQNIATVSSRIYEVQPSDYTLLCDTKECPITVVLPPACNNTGRVISIKKASSDKYKINSYPVVLKVSEGNIDRSDETVIKTNYSFRSVQSDGENWWVVGAKGT